MTASQSKDFKSEQDGFAEWVSGSVRRSGLRAWAGDVEFWVGQGRGSVMASGGIEARNGKK